MPDLPHFRMPFGRAANGQVAVVEQDTDDHILGCEEVIVRCPTGWRDDRPEFGWPFPEFRPAPLNLTQLSAALAEFEPRGRADVTEWADLADAATRHISINVEAS